MKLYHVTTGERAVTSLRKGFRDGVGSYGTDQQCSGVWLSDRPLDCNDPGKVDADTILAVSLDCELDHLSKYEFVEEGRSYREWLIPAEFVNKRTVAIVQMDTDERAS
jgi:hypothetical protein